MLNRFKKIFQHQPKQRQQVVNNKPPNAAAPTACSSDKDAESSEVVVCSSGDEAESNDISFCSDDKETESSEVVVCSSGDEAESNDISFCSDDEETESSEVVVCSSGDEAESNDISFFSDDENLPPLVNFDVNIDALLRILFYLNPVSLSYLSRTNKFFNPIATSESLWEMLLFRHFVTLNNVVPRPGFKHAGVNGSEGSSNTFQLFNTTSKEHYPGFSAQDIERFTLVRDNDLYTIEEKNIDFTIEMLNKYDSRGHTLLSLIRKQNNPELNAYVFRKICEHQHYTQTQLIQCAFQLDIADDFVVGLLANKNINETIIDDSTCLSLAVKHNSLHSAALLIKLGADPNLTHGDLSHPLYLAAQEGKLEMVNLLLDHGANIDLLFKNEFSPLFIAALKGHLDVVKCLIYRCANINLRMTNGTPLYIAMQEGQTAVVEYLLEQGANIKLRYKNFLPLYVGSRNNHLDGVKALLAHCKKHKLDLSINDNGGDGSTALYVAAQNGHEKIVQLLAKEGANVESEFLGGYTPLYVAAKKGHDKVIEVLLQYKLSINRISPNGSAALFVAAENGHAKVVGLLCKQPSCDIHTIYTDGYTPLYTACLKGHLPVVKILLEHGANINQQTRRNATPLYTAAEKGHKDIVALLLANRADPHLRFENGWTPLHVLCERQGDYDFCMSMITLLIRAGAEPLPADLYGRTSANVAKNQQVKYTLELLASITEQDLRPLCMLPWNYAADTQAMINAINALIAGKSQDLTDFINQAKLIAKLLMDTSTPFSCAVVLYCFLNKNSVINTNRFMYATDHQKLIQCITNTLDFQSSVAASQSLYSLICASLGSDKNLLDKLQEVVIKPLMHVFIDQKEIDHYEYDKIMLCLNLFESRIKQSLILKPDLVKMTL